MRTIKDKQKNQIKVAIKTIKYLKYRKKENKNYNYNKFRA